MFSHAECVAVRFSFRTVPARADLLSPFSFSFLLRRFAVLVIPEYEDPDDKLSSPFPPGPNDGEKDWVWFSTMNRVNTQVLKVRSLPLSPARVPVPTSR